MSDYIIMELKEYLEKSKLQRKETIKIAEKYYNKTISSDFGNSNMGESPDVFPSPNPRRLKMFESEINKELQKFFTPGLTEDKETVKYLTHSSLNERIRKTYSRNSPTLRRKQLVILPKNYFLVPLKIPEVISHAHHRQSTSPDKIITKFEPGTNKTLPPQKKIIKESLLFPILTTIGSHEQRSKLYKYK